MGTGGGQRSGQGQVRLVSAPVQLPMTRQQLSRQAWTGLAGTLPPPVLPPPAPTRNAQLPPPRPPDTPQSMFEEPSSGSNTTT